MIAKLSRLMPKGIVSQILVLICGIVLLSFAILYLFFTLTRSQQDYGGPAYLDGRISMAMTMIAAARPEERQEILDKISAAMPESQISLSTALLPEGLEQGSMTRMRPPFLRLPENADYWIDRNEGTPSPSSQIRVFIRLGDGQLYLARLPVVPPPPLAPAINLVITFLFILVALTVWAARALTGPLRALGKAATHHTALNSDMPFSEQGPQEVRELARALNQMQERILSLLHERTRFLVAVSHDLRTPITRLRLRTEMSSDNNAKQSTLNDLAQMEQLIEGTLLYLRNGQTGEKPSRIDLTSLMMTICDTYADIGITIPLNCPPGLNVRLRVSEIERAVINLIENALKYAGSASLKVSETSNTIIIDVEDEGPGIPADQQEELLQPFSRGDKARTLSTQNGFGLGLSICRAICESHGGSLTLHNLSPRGLRARMTLPKTETKPDR